MTKMSVTDALFTALDAATKRTLIAAGPRYSPAIDADAPNLHIDSLRRAGSALCLGSLFRLQLAELAATLNETQDRNRELSEQLFLRRQVTPSTIGRLLEEARDCEHAPAMRALLLRARRHSRLVQATIARHEQIEARKSQELAATKNAANGDEAEHQRLVSMNQGRLRGLQAMAEALFGLQRFFGGAESRSLIEVNAALLLGSWGTGKTHFVCDFALEALSDGTPAVAVLADSLRPDMTPLDAIAAQLGIGTSGIDLLDRMGEVARALGRRALVLIDAINESDRKMWRRYLPELIEIFAKRTDVAVLLTCRTPFNEEIVAPAVQKSVVELWHPGFEDQEFDAQFEFFTYYKLPALHVPFLTSEFSRPLFLKLLCRGLAQLSKQTQKRQLQQIASGQKGMTFVLENFVKHVGVEVESRYQLPAKTCWFILKGTGVDRPGVAGMLAEAQRDWLTADEAIEQVDLRVASFGADGSLVLRDMVRAGLLAEGARYFQGVVQTVITLPYQRFSDHLVARHLLERHLDTSTVERVRRSLYANRPLGRSFVLDRWGRTYLEPGIASALMIEFPERMKRLAGGGPTELAAYLPRGRMLVTPFAEAFVDGLYWRGPGGFSAETAHLVGRLLALGGADVRYDLFNVLTGLGSREAHPWNAAYLHERLSRLTMADRDLAWSEYLRTADEQSNARRLIAWFERVDATTISPQAASNAIELLMLVCTTTDRVLRDRATRCMVLIGSAHPSKLFRAALDALRFNDPYVSERALAASYGVAMRRWSVARPGSVLAVELVALARSLVAQILLPGSCHSTWHTLTRDYAIGIVRIAKMIRPRSTTPAEWDEIARVPGPSESPFRPGSEISQADAAIGEDAIHMDFGNYTLGHLVRGRANYDMKQPEYALVRRQVADRVRALGYSKSKFETADNSIVRSGQYRSDDLTPDRYGKKYSWIAYFEMYGLRKALGLLNSDWAEPRCSDADIDPTFPDATPTWEPTLLSIFPTSPTNEVDWLSSGEVPYYRELLHLDEVDGISGDWLLLDAVISESTTFDNRELRGYLDSMYVPRRSLERVLIELQKRPYGDQSFPTVASDDYAFQGEVPWAPTFGNDARRKDGKPTRLPDTAFDYYSSKRWQEGLKVEGATRHVDVDSRGSALSKVSTLVFPSLRFADFHGLRVIDGVSNMVDSALSPATIFRRTPGPAYGSYFMFARRDLVDAYLAAENLVLVQAIRGERTLHYRQFERSMSEDLRSLLQSRSNNFVEVVWR